MKLSELIKEKQEYLNEKGDGEIVLTLVLRRKSDFFSGVLYKLALLILNFIAVK